MAALSCYDQDSPDPKAGGLSLAYRASHIQYMICYPRSSRKDSRSYTDSRRLSIRSTNGKDYTHCTCENVLEEDIVKYPLWRQRSGTIRGYVVNVCRFSRPVCSSTPPRWHIMNTHPISCIQWIFLVPDVGIEPTFENYKFPVFTIGRIRRYMSILGLEPRPFRTTTSK